MDLTLLLAVLLALFAAGGLAVGTQALGRLQGIPAARLGAALGKLPSEPAGSLHRLLEITTPLARLSRPDDPEQLSGLRLRLLHAGWRSPLAPAAYYGAKSALALLFPLPVVTSLAALGKESGNGLLFVTLCCAALGYYLPNAVLRWRIARQQEALFNAFPDAIDLIIVCVEAGLGLDAALARTAQEMVLRSPALAEELQLTLTELRIGAAREQALANLAKRTGVAEIGALVSTLRQSARLGTSIGQSLRVHADTLRTRRRQAAEEAAAKIPLKLLFPLIFCIFPALMLVLLGPAVISLQHIFMQTVK